MKPRQSPPPLFLHMVPEAVAYLNRYLASPAKSSHAGELALVDSILGQLVDAGSNLGAVFAAISPGSGRRVFGFGTAPIPPYGALRTWLLEVRKLRLGKSWPESSSSTRDESGTPRCKVSVDCPPNRRPR